MATSIRPKKFRIGHGDEVRAVEVTEENYIKVAEWTGVTGALALTRVDENGDQLDHRVRIRTPFGVRTANVGDWVYKNLSDGKVYVAKEAEFTEKFVAIPPTPRKKK